MAGREHSRKTGERRSSGGRRAAGGSARRSHRASAGRRGAGRRGRRRRASGGLAVWGICLALVVLAAAGVLRLTAGGASSERRQLRQEGIASLEAGDYDAALNSFEQALAASKGRDKAFDRDVLLYRAETEFKLKDYQAALHTCQLLTEAGEESLTLRYWSSICYAKLGDWGNALSVYEETAAGETGDAWSTGRLEALAAAGDACVKNGENEKAMELYQPAIEKGMGNGQIYNQVGLCQMAEKDYQNALDSFDKGLAVLAEEYSAPADASAVQLKAALEEAQTAPAGETGGLSGDLSVLRELAFNQAAAQEYMEQYEKALSLFQAYTDAFGADDRAQHEIDFLKTR